ncbi:energy transducer TonB [bacterium]|nr:energy transducer TonB [bacterium]NUN44479.1 energy transducer TonB [bacterium]
MEKVMQSDRGFKSVLAEVYQKNMVKGLSAGVVLHAFIIGTIVWVIGQNPKAVKQVMNQISILVDMPPLTNIPEIPAINLPQKFNPGDIIKGIPIITPDAIVSPDITIPSQDDWIEKFSDNSVPMDWNNLDVSLPNFENVSIDSKNTTSGEFTIVEQMPEVIHRVKPEYPSLPRQAGIEGRVYVKGLVNEEGMVTRTVFASGDEIFYNAASETFLKTRFKPGINGGVAVKVWVMMPFTFRLR